MIRIQTMDDFEEYIHALAKQRCTDEDVLAEKETYVSLFQVESSEEALAPLLQQLFAGLDAWRDGEIETWVGTSYTRSVLAFIGYPAEHGRLLTSIEDIDGDDEEW